MGTTRSNKGENTPAMQQFFRAKARYPDALIFFRMGDFYELFFEDAVVAAKALDLTLTSRSRASDGEAIPMAGVPHHASGPYLARLLEKGFKVAICEQMADPKTVRGLVPREVVRVLTPGTYLDDEGRGADPVIASVVWGDDGGSICSLRFSALSFRVCDSGDLQSTIEELLRLSPTEVVACGDESFLSHLRGVLEVQRGRSRVEAKAEVVPRGAAERGNYAVQQLKAYVRSLHPIEAQNLKLDLVEEYVPTSFLQLQSRTLQHLEIFSSQSGDTNGSFFFVVNKTLTAVGARELGRRLAEPLFELAPIRARHEEVEALAADALELRSVRASLAQVYDLERNLTRVELGTSSVRDLFQIRGTLRAARDLTRHCQLEENLLSLLGTLEQTLVDDMPKGSGEDVVRPSVSSELDSVRALREGGQTRLAQLERSVREHTGINTLKLRYTRVFGYYFEVTKSNVPLVPEYFRRKQTVAGGERYTTPELDVLSESILGADERIEVLQLEVLADLARRCRAERQTLRRLVYTIASLDVAQSMATLANAGDYVRPELDESRDLEFEELRHPVVEAQLERGTFVPNDILLTGETSPFALITGPNMGGKSTAMRQVALAVILAQAGGFVPAKRARIGLVDRVFSRLGASDNVSRGESTFMVEMIETAEILRQATPRSLVLLDEVGRGTSTQDGLAIARAVSEWLVEKSRCRTLFATHFMELADLAVQFTPVRNWQVSVAEHEGRIVMLHRLVKGAASSSFGLEVAQLAGVPQAVVNRARELINLGEETQRKSPSQPEQKTAALAPDITRLLAQISTIDVAQTRPVEALLLLEVLQAAAKRSLIAGN